MKQILLLLALACVATLARSDLKPPPKAGGWSIAPVSAMHKITATAPGLFEPFPTRPALLQAARGEWENFQVVVTAGAAPLHDVRLSSTTLVSTLGHVLEADNLAVFHERFVRVAQPSGNRRLEKLWWPDALVPLKWQPVEIAAGQSAAFWVSVRIPDSAPPATYFGVLDIECSEDTKQLFIGVEVNSARVPAPTMRATAALYYDVLRDWYTKNIGPQSDASWNETKRAYYDFLLPYRINAYDLPVGPEEAAFAGYAHNPAVLSIRTPPIDSPNFAPFMQGLEANGAARKAFSYTHDEPSPDQYAAIKADGQKLRAAGVKQLVTAAPNAALLKAVGIWCPNIGDALGLGHLDLEALERARKRSEETWWYTMTVPRAPYPTWLLDDEAGSVRAYGWQMARWKVSGFVYSMVHGWGPRPLDDLRSFAGSNGDGTLLYPGELAGGHGPMPSIRLMVLRDAIEDYELLNLLPDAQRLAITSRVAGASPAERRDRDSDWENETYRTMLFAALTRKAAFPPLFRPVGKQLPIAIQKAATAHATDGTATRGEWPDGAQADTSFRRFNGDPVPPPPIQLYLARRGGSLLVGLRAEDPGVNEWCAVEIAPADARERWRFVVTSRGKTTVERHTREGHFGIEGAQWKGMVQRESGKQAMFYEWSIPLELVAGDTAPFRLNVLRRVDDAARDARYTVRAWADDGDVTRMPLTGMPPASK